MSNVGVDDHTTRLQNLKSKREGIIKRQLDILEKINKLMVTRPTKEDLVVTFVNEIEKAYQYFEFKEHLKQDPKLMKHDSDRFHVFKKVVNGKIHRDYDKLDFQDIMYAVEEGLYDLYFEEHPEKCELIQEGDGCAFLSPLTELVHKMKNNGYILKDPLVELLDIKKKDILFYNQTFVRKLFEHNSAKKVVVRNIPIEFNEEQVKQLLMECGEVESVTIESSEPWGKVAFVTFKDSESAKIAPILMTQTCHTTLPCPEVDFSSCHTTLPCPELPPVPSPTEFEKAQKKYEEFRKPEGGNKKPKIDTSDGAYSGPHDMLFG